MFYKRHFDHRFDLLELYLTVRDPGTAKAAEAYDGLRKLLINANKGTQLHLAQLAEIHRVASAADSVEPVLAKVEEFMSQIGLKALFDPDHALRDELYQFAGGKGSEVVVDSPAYISIDGAGGETLIMRGAAHFESDHPATEHPSRKDEGDTADTATRSPTPPGDVSEHDEPGGGAS